MTKAHLSSAPTPQLVADFVALCLQQQDALEDYDVRRYNKIYVYVRAIVDELKKRDGDRRRDLLPLCRHENIQVRLTAAQKTLALAPAEARAVLERIRDSGELPQALDAGMMLLAIDQGIYTPS